MPPIALIVCAHKDVIMDVHRDSELGSDGDFDGRPASSSLVIGREAADLREASAPGSSVGAVALRHDISRSQIYQWRRAFRAERLRSESFAVVDFLLVEVCDGGGDGAPSVDRKRLTRLTLTHRSTVPRRSLRNPKAVNAVMRRLRRCREWPRV
ncbi:MAG: transposase [Rhizobiales bacterium]|nr:transposase [Hyphomicrobiales bacterium]